MPKENSLKEKLMNLLPNRSSKKNADEPKKQTAKEKTVKIKKRNFIFQKST